MSLEQYAAYREAVIGVCARARTLDELTRLLKADLTVEARRFSARTELQAIFNLIRGHFGIPALPVYLPVRKKIAVRGQAHTCVGIPKEIRIYTVEGSWKPYNQWAPSDITCSSVPETLEYLVHEAAHVLETHQHRAISHDENFVAAYDEVDQFLKTRGFAPPRDPSLRLMGAPKAVCCDIGAECRTTATAVNGTARPRLRAGRVLERCSHRRAGRSGRTMVSHGATPVPLARHYGRGRGGARSPLNVASSQKDDMNRDPQDPIGLVPDPLAGDLFVFPSTKCTRERRLFFKRANEIHALLFITKHAYDETNKIYQQRIRNFPKRERTPVKTELKTGHSMIFPAALILRLSNDAINILTRQAFIMFYGSFETYLF